MCRGLGGGAEGRPPIGLLEYGRGRLGGLGPPPALPRGGTSSPSARRRGRTYVAPGALERDPRAVRVGVARRGALPRRRGDRLIAPRPPLLALALAARRRAARRRVAPAGRVARVEAQARSVRPIAARAALAPPPRLRRDREVVVHDGEARRALVRRDVRRDRRVEVGRRARLRRRRPRRRPAGARPRARRARCRGSCAPRRRSRRARPRRGSCDRDAGRRPPRRPRRRRRGPTSAGASPNPR